MSFVPKLTEPGIKYFLNQSLKNCHSAKVLYYNKLVNVSVFVLFMIILGSILLYKYKGKLTPEELKRKEQEKYKYILDKVQKVKIDKLKLNQELITGLPNWNNDFENI
jgi:hypothetical protein